MEKIARSPELECFLPLVMALYGTQSRFLWIDDEGQEHIIVQGEGGEQGDPLMPALYSLAQHDALVEADGELGPSERILSFLDDLYVVTSRERAADAFLTVSTTVEKRAGVKTHLGKLKAWCAGGGAAPEDLARISPEAWKADLPDHQNGIKVLGTPFGKPEFVAAFAEERMESERVLLERLAKLDDPQCAWLMLSMSAVPRANHFIRMLPPSQSTQYAQAHDEAVWSCFTTLMGTTELRDDALARHIATLPARMGGLGLRSAERSAQAAFWASWVNALPVIKHKQPALAAIFKSELQSATPTGSFVEAAAAREALVRTGADLPTWDEAESGAEPPVPEEMLDAADLARGWQCTACSFVEHHFREQDVLPLCDEPRRALLLSQSSGAAGAWLRAIPAERAMSMTPLRFQVAIRRRLRWPLPLSTGQCCRGCRTKLDVKGDRAAACGMSGRIKLRSKPVEKTWARIFRESGASVRENVLLRDTAVPGLDPADGRKIEVVATGLPVARGVPLAIDATVISPLHADGTAWAKAARVPGQCFARAYKHKEDTYPELVDSNVLRLSVAAVEIGGRVCSEALELLEGLAAAKARTEPKALRRQAARMWKARWTTLLAVAVQDAVAATLVDDGSRFLDAADCPAPASSEVWLDCDCL